MHQIAASVLFFLSSCFFFFLLKKAKNAYQSQLAVGHI